MFVLGALIRFRSGPADRSVEPAIPAKQHAIQPPVDDANLFIPNVTPDAGLSAPFNSLFTFFGQFFDHGVDLITKGGNGTVFIPLPPDDPLSRRPDGIAGTGDEVTDAAALHGADTRDQSSPGPDGMLGTADDALRTSITTTPFVDQSQTYSSDPSHQVFLREYMIGADGKLHSTGGLLTGTDWPTQHMATWGDLKANALTLGIKLTDADVGNVPLLATDAYGNFILGAHGLAQLVVDCGTDGDHGTPDDGTVSGAQSGRRIHGTPRAHAATSRARPCLPRTTSRTTPRRSSDASGALAADADTRWGRQPCNPQTGELCAYDDELLNAHYVAGDGRVNENIGLTADPRPVPFRARPPGRADQGDGPGRARHRRHFLRQPTGCCRAST